MIEFQKRLSIIERVEIINDICKVYHYNSNNKIKLYKKTDNQLIAFRENLRNRHDLIESFKCDKYYIQAILNTYGANKYYIEKKAYIIRIYIGFISNVKDKYGRFKNYQYGYIDIGKNNVIKELNMYGKILDKFKGSSLIIQ